MTVRFAERERFDGGFCSNPECDCWWADRVVCEGYFPAWDTAGFERCARCGNWRKHHDADFTEE